MDAGERAERKHVGLGVKEASVYTCERTSARRNEELYTLVNIYVPSAVSRYAPPQSVSRTNLVQAKTNVKLNASHRITQCIYRDY